MCSAARLQRSSRPLRSRPATRSLSENQGLHPPPCGSAPHLRAPSSARGAPPARVPEAATPGWAWLEPTARTAPLKRPHRPQRRPRGPAPAHPRRLVERWSGAATPAPPRARAVPPQDGAQGSHRLAENLRKWLLAAIHSHALVGSRSQLGSNIRSVEPLGTRLYSSKVAPTHTPWGRA